MQPLRHPSLTAPGRMSVQSLVSRIEAVFPELPLPDMTLRQAQLADETLDREISQEEWDPTPAP